MLSKRSCGTYVDLPIPEISVQARSYAGSWACQHSARNRGIHERPSVDQDSGQSGSQHTVRRVVIAQERWFV